MRVVVARPRGFCAGVERAIKTVERAIEKFGKPVYVFNPIVHNRHVVAELIEKGAVFVRAIEDVPEGALLLFSAHGVPPEALEKAKARNLKIIDATCPLVERVHRHARKYAEIGYTVILIGDAEHDETKGTLGWALGKGIIVSNKQDAERLTINNSEKLVYVTQTTLSIDDCGEIIEVLRKRFANIESPAKSNICYATTNRQRAVKALAEQVEAVIVVGDEESANSKRLAEIAQKTGKPTVLVLDSSALDLEWLKRFKSLLITSGASVPEKFVKEVISFINEIEPSTVEEITVVEEEVHFLLPSEVR
ncbi:MAG: 4-hydroxy-3-methylbut-2-enyl diphosphate reductase [Candidatus Hydrogenedentes bacterium]|nr:4-hydroxy-3-methylbut-2-enyl diphosphate reductase [Candidatus Hydrogenedentota bacterium]